MHRRSEATDLAEVGHLVFDVRLAHVLDQLILSGEGLVTDPVRQEQNIFIR